MDCPRCGASEVIEIQNTIEDIELYFFSCHRCEEHWWDRDGKKITLTDVLELARQRLR